MLVLVTATSLLTDEMSVLIAATSDFNLVVSALIVATSWAVLSVPVELPQSTYR